MAQKDPFLLAVEGGVDGPDARGVELDREAAHHLNLVVVLVGCDDAVAAVVEHGPAVKPISLVDCSTTHSHRSIIHACVISAFKERNQGAAEVREAGATSCSHEAAAGGQC